MTTTTYLVLDEKEGVKGVYEARADAQPKKRSVGADRNAGSEKGRSDVRDAVKQLSSGHAFRSLYGLLRDRHAISAAHHGESIAQKAVAEAKG